MCTLLLRVVLLSQIRVLSESPVSLAHLSLQQAQAQAQTPSLGMPTVTPSTADLEAALPLVVPPSPPPSPAVVPEGEDGGGKSCFSVCCFLRALIAWPLFGVAIMLSLFFWALWLFLMPIKCCCPCGSLVSCIEWLFKTATKLPVSVLRCIV